MLIDDKEIQFSRSLTEKGSFASPNSRLDRLSEREKVENLNPQVSVVITTFANFPHPLVILVILFFVVVRITSMCLC